MKLSIPTMKLFHTGISLIMILLFSTSLLAQKNDGPSTVQKNEYCTDYHRSACTFDNKDIEWKYNGQSRSALFRPGQKSSFTFSAYKGYDYRFSLAGAEIILSGQKIIFKVKDAKTKAILYDSEVDESIQQFEFVCDNSLNVLVELELPEGDGVAGNKVLYGCVGFLLQSRRTMQTGFK